MKEQINIKTGIERERLVNLVNTVEDILDSVQQYKSMQDSKRSDLKREESTTEIEGLKIITPDQMLSRLPIFLAQWKAGNNSEKLKKKKKLGYYCILCTDPKNLQNNFIKVLLKLFKTWKQFLWTAKTVKQANHTDLN